MNRLATTAQTAFETPIDSMIEDEQNPRGLFRNMEELIATVRQDGVIQPLLVMPLNLPEKPGVRYRILDGHRRYRAANAVGLQQLPIVVCHPSDEISGRVLVLIANLHRDEFDTLGLAQGLRRVMRMHAGISTQRQLSQVLHKSESWVSKMLRILDLPEDLQAKLSTSKVPVCLEAISAITAVKEAKEQEKLIEALCAGATNLQIRQRIQALKRRPRLRRLKRSYRTSLHATVTIAVRKGNLGDQTAIAALQEALRQAEAGAI